MACIDGGLHEVSEKIGRAWRRVLLSAGLVMACAPACAAVFAPVLLGRMDLGPDFGTWRASRDGRLLAVTSGIRILPAGRFFKHVRFIDLADPQRPSVSADVALEVGDLWEISPDGKRLLAATIDPPDSSSAKPRRRLVAVDLAHPRLPRVLWQRDIGTDQLTLAPDAEAYAYTRPVAGKEKEREAVVTWLDDRRMPVRVSLGEREGELLLGAGGSYLAFRTDDETVTTDLHGEIPVSFRHSMTVERMRALAIFPDGRLLVKNGLTDRLHVYPMLPGAASMAPLEVGNLWDADYDTALPFGAPALVGSKVLVKSDHYQWGELLDLSPGRAPSRTTLALPAEGKVLGIDAEGQRLFVKEQESGNPAVLAIYDVARAAPLHAEWQALEAAWHQAKSLEARGGVMPEFDARRVFESAHPLLALNTPLENVTKRDATSILTDYARLAQGNNDYDRARDRTRVRAYLARAVMLDPTYAPAQLGLAENLRASIANATDWARKQTLRKEARLHYRRYLALGGRRTAAIDAFLDEKLDRHPPVDLCGAVIGYANAGRLQELLSDVVLGVPYGSRPLDIAFFQQGTGRFPDTAALDALDGSEVRDEVAYPDDEESSPDDTYAWVVYRKSAQILHLHDMTHPVSSISIDGRKRCHFRIVTTERVGAKALESRLCSTLQSRHRPPALIFETPPPLSEEEIRKEYHDGRPHFTGARQVDLGNDGHRVNVVAAGASMPGGSGCETDFFDALDADGRHFDHGRAADLLERLQGFQEADPHRSACDNQPEFFRHGGRTYFENRPNTRPPVDDRHLYHRVARVRDGKVEDVCGFSFQTRVVKGSPPKKKMEE